MNTQTALSGTQRPNRVKHSYTQSVSATPDNVFPLLCPVREHDWAPGWSTDWIISGSGLVEQECLFQTPPKAGAKDASIWIVTRHDPSAYEVEMYKVTPGQTIGKLAISLTEQGRTETRAQISYEFTSLGPDGDAFLDNFTTEWYEKFMQGWETAINHYLRTGEQLNVAA
jgi:hypothetical protein